MDTPINPLMHNAFPLCVIPIVLLKPFDLAVGGGIYVLQCWTPYFYAFVTSHIFGQKKKPLIVSNTKQRAKQFVFFFKPYIRLNKWIRYT